MMKKYFVNSIFKSEIQAKNLNDAKSKVLWDYANAGKIELIEVEYEKVKETIHIIDPDY